MNSEDIFQLFRSGNLFASMSPNRARDFHILRRQLLIDCPNTYSELTVHNDGSTSGGQDMTATAAAILDNITNPRIEHREWAPEKTDKSLGSSSSPQQQVATSQDVLIRSEEDPFYFRGCALFVVPRRIDYRFHNLAIDTPEDTKTIGNNNIKNSSTSLSVVTGLALNSIAMLNTALTSTVRHRCSIQVLSLPKQSIPNTSPQRHDMIASSNEPVSPSKQNAVDYFDRQKSFTPHCCFGIFCPDLPEEPHINKDLPHRANFTSRRWLGVYWSDGTSVPGLGLLGAMSTAGTVKIERLKRNQVIAVGDVITVEVRPEENLVLFLLNGVEAGRLTLSSTMPIATRLESSYFAVRLSEGASVATF
ncbi:Hypothetical protein, putative [Bodo saltans]|uniref:Uncharacterized protein n=1 Tax=Bodo saltans TaxID=75058 RepID=A0A0S4IM81_BODSA|nr:Hypothetical protein, putative [Bodo saltans]|eukprot:CUE63973.1 Hypothetical protein, putative [Bodo saltans]